MGEAGQKVQTSSAKKKKKKKKGLTNLMIKACWTSGGGSS